jgi:protein involved in polysaccharide export with SLBB domain
MVSVELSGGLDPAFLAPPQIPFRLGPGDRLDIELLGEGDGPWPTFVGPDGRLYFHLLPGLQVWGLTLEETRQLIERQAAAFVRSPQVTLTLREVQSQRVWVLGRVNSPGIYPLDAPTTLIEAIARAGGLFTSRFSGTTEELADLHHSFVVRDGQVLPLNFHRLIREGDTSQNIYLRPDDFVYLPSSLSSEVYVLGAVGQPRAVGFKDQVTLVSAIANARGTVRDAWLSHVAIVRGSLSSPQVAIVNYGDIVRGKAPDVRLEPRDIVYVPLAPYRSLKNYANLIVNTFVRTVAANEGGRAVNPNYRKPGVSIPITQ